MEQTIAIENMIVNNINESIQSTVRKERKKLFGFIRSRVGNEADAEDILQDVFYRFVSTMQSDPIESITSWLFKVARNRIIDWYRRSKSVSFDEMIAFDIENDEATYLPLLLDDVLFDPVENPDELYFRSTIWPLLSEALDELPDEQSEVFIMNELEGKSFKEIEEITGEPVNTLISRKHYAILHLRDRLEDLYEEFFQ